MPPMIAEVRPNIGYIYRFGVRQLLQPHKVKERFEATNYAINVKLAA